MSCSFLHFFFYLIHLSTCLSCICFIYLIFCYLLFYIFLIHRHSFFSDHKVVAFLCSLFFVFISVRLIIFFIHCRHYSRSRSVYFLYLSVLCCHIFLFRLCYIKRQYFFSFFSFIIFLLPPSVIINFCFLSK